MSHKPTFTVILLLILSTAVFAQNAKEKFVVAISGKLKDENTADILATRINRAIINSELYIVLPNDPELMNALKKTWKGNLIGDQTIISLAQNSNADHLCLAKITRYNDKDQITLQWVKLKTEPIELGRTGVADGNLTKFDDFKDKIDEAVKDMLGTTGSSSGKGNKTFTDPRDKKQYKVVEIGSQTWMAENLNYNASGSKCYENDESNCKKYGRLYNWATAKKACPEDWHLPSKGEWDILVNFAGGEKISGKKLKAVKGWNYDDEDARIGNGTDELDFSALPGGYGNSNGGFSNVGNNGYWWSSSENIIDIAYSRLMRHNSEYVDSNNNFKDDLFSVRCLQD